MTMTKQDLHQAKKRGLVTAKHVETAKPTRHRRHCPACGETFLPPTPNHRGFCCACCAEAWGALYEKSTLDRLIARGVEVLLLEDGAVGVVESVPDAEQAILVMEDGRRLTVGPKMIERIQYLPVVHLTLCRKNAGPWTAKRTQEADKVVGPTEEEGGG